MSDVDMLLRDTLQDRAQSAPSGTGLLARVHTRSRLFRRRRRLGVAGTGVAAIVLAAAGVPVLADLTAGDPGTGVAPGGTTAPDGSQAGGTPIPSGSRPLSPSGFAAVLGPPEVPVLAFPFRPPTGVVPGLGAPRAMVAGTVYLSHPAATEDSPLVDVHTGTAEPAAPDTAGTVATTEQVRLRGTQGFLRTETVDSHTSRTLYWRESADQWVWIRADRVEPAAMIAYATGLRPGSVEVIVPFTFDVLPTGLTVEEVGPGTMVFRLPGRPSGGNWTGKLAVLLNADGGAGAASWPLRVDGRPAQLVQQDDGRSLIVELTDGGNLLVIQVPADLVISDADLLAMAAGVQVTSSAKAANG